MSTNQILRSKLVGKIVKGGKEVAIAAATETQLWTRPDFVADERGPGFIKAVEQSPKPLPHGTVKVIMREGEHARDNDPKTPYTVVIVDMNDKHISTLYFEKKR